MALTKGKPKPIAAQLEKSPTGIKGLDEITFGGLPTGRPTLVCGTAGSGKTLLGMEFLVRGAMEFGEPGVFMSFEETGQELTKNVVSLGFNLNDLVARKKLLLDYVHIERSEIEETGEYDLEGLFIRLGHAIDSIKAKRVVLDTIETLFSGLPNPSIVRAELKRLFRWLKDKGLTAVITGEQGSNQLTRSRPGRIRFRLRYFPGPPNPRTNLHPAPAHRQIPGLPARHQRISLPHRRNRNHRHAHHFHGLEAHGEQPQGFHRHPPSGCHVGRKGILCGQFRPDIGYGRHGQDQRCRFLCGCGLPEG